MRKILAAPLAAGLVLGSTMSGGAALAQTTAGDTRASAGNDEIVSFFEDLQQREQERFDRFFARESRQRSGAELRELQEFGTFFEAVQQRENEEFQQVVASEQVEVSPDFATRLSEEFPQATRGLSNDRLVLLAERVCVTLQSGAASTEVAGLGDERASDRSALRRDETRGETGTEARSETARTATARTALDAQGEAEAFVQLVLGTGDRTTQEIVEFIDQEACDITAGGEAGDQAVGTDQAATQDVVETLRSEFPDATSGLSDERLSILVDDVRNALENDNLAQAEAQVAATLDVPRAEAEEIVTSIEDALQIDAGATATADASAEINEAVEMLQTEFRAATRGISEERLTTLVEDAQSSLEAGDVERAEAQVQATLDVGAGSAERITQSISDTLGL